MSKQAMNKDDLSDGVTIASVKLFEAIIVIHSLRDFPTGLRMNPLLSL